MRVPQREGTRGSLRWLQTAINRSPEILDSPAIGPIKWLSPLSADDYAEYSDETFLDLLGLSSLRNTLGDFWPRRGPRWDALGRSGKTVIIAEAKAHIGEFLSTATTAKGESRTKIERSLSETRAALGATGNADWSNVSTSTPTALPICIF